MKTLFFLISLILTSISTSPVFCQGIVRSNDTIINHTSDTTASTSPNDSTDLENDFSPGLFFIAMVGFGFMLLGVGCGIALTFIVVLVLSGLISLGVLSAAVLVGLNKKSYTAGFKTFIILGSLVGGIFLGSAGLWVLNKIMKWWTTETALLSGSLAGLTAELLFGYTSWYFLWRLTGYIMGKLKT
ncbi:MAG: hypothetical protein IPL22_16345 [Bacteroidetes bacterium]|nr:hypothetical protein [Bacteroidota bacterium]